MSFLITENGFNIAAYALTGASYVYGWGEAYPPAALGLQCFCIASCLDAVARRMFIKNQPNPYVGLPALCSTAIAAVVEELGYAGVLQTENAWWAVPRFLGVVVTGMTATKCVVSIPKDASPPKLDLQIGFVWAIVREAILQCAPSLYSKPLLCCADSIVFALSELAPLDLQNKPALSYKIISSALFRTLANVAAWKQGIGASIVQHVLFNVSRSLP